MKPGRVSVFQILMLPKLCLIRLHEDIRRAKTLLTRTTNLVFSAQFTIQKNSYRPALTILAIKSRSHLYLSR